MVQNSQDCSQTSTKSIYSVKKILGVPLNLAVFIIILGIAIGASIYIENLTGKIDVSPIDYSTLVPLDFNNGDTFAMNGGSSVIKNFRMDNTGATYAMDGLVTFSVTEITLENNDCKIWLRDSAGAELVEDSTVESHKLSVTTTYSNIPAGSSREGKFEVQCHPDYDQELSFTLTMEPVSKFTFKD